MPETIARRARNLSRPRQFYRLRGIMAAREPASETDERILVEAAQRDPARFGDLYEVHFEQVYAFISRRVPDRNIAEDLTSEVFHKALANLRKYEWRGAPFAVWLVRIATNIVAGAGERT